MIGKKLKYVMLEVRDSDNDGREDTVVTKDGKVYSLLNFSHQILIIHYIEYL
jgi:hypothetical protein